MGLFDLLFKSRADRAREKRVGKEEGEAGAQLDSTAFLVPRERAPILPVAPRSAPVERLRSGLRPASPARQIVVTLGDVIARIPPEFLREGDADLRRELRFGTDEFLADIPRGRVTVALSNIAAQCPEVFRAPITDDDDREVRLPLQKVLDQLVGSGLALRPLAEKAEQIPANSAPATAPAAPSIPEVQEVREFPERPVPDPIPATAADSDGRTIQLSLAAILAGCPEDLFLGERPQVDDSVRVSLPFEPIERQLTNAVVEISAQRFVTLLPPPFSGCIHVREGLKIPLPLEEIFQNLPGGSGAARPLPSVAELPVSEVPAPAQTPEPPPPAPAPPPPVIPVAEAAPTEAFQFFSPAPPHPRPVPPPPLSGRPIAQEVSHAPQVDAFAAPPPAIILPLRPPEIRPSVAEPAAVEPSPQTSPPPTLESSSVPVSAGPTFQWSRPPVTRPLVVLPPPVAVTTAPIPAPPVADPEPPMETTSDQTAVLEFLSGGSNAEPQK